MRQSWAMLVLICASASAQALDPSKLVGIWKSEQSAMVGHATAYMNFQPQGLCTQVTKGVIFGSTKWASLQCRWALRGDALDVTVTGPASLKDAIGKTIRYRVAQPSADALTLEAEGKSQSSTRVDAIPAEFVAHLAQ